MNPKAEILATGNATTGEVTKTAHDLALALRTKLEQGRQGQDQNDISAALAQKLEVYGFIEQALPTSHKESPKN